MTTYRSFAWRLAAPCMLAACAALPAAAAAVADYTPVQQVSGTLRSRGDPQMAALLKPWQNGFQQYQPGVRFEDTLTGNDSGIYGLEMRTADFVVMGRPINPFERYGTYERSWTYPVELEVATGSYAQPAKSGAYAVLVHADNPLAGLTLQQLDGIFGAERLGGWKALSWDESAARPASANLRTWGQLGLTGAWAGKPIHVYGPASQGAGSISFFQARVLGGGAMWNEALREYADRDKMLADLAADPDGIAYAELAAPHPALKALALAQGAAGPFVPFTRAAVANRSYALARPVYIDYTIDNLRSEIASPRVEPKLREFLRYVLSKQGQREVAREGHYLPLPAAVVAEQLGKLSAEGVPPEQTLLHD